MSRLRNALVSNYAGQSWAAIMNVAFIPLYIKYLGIESFGLIGVFTIVLTCSLLLDAGLTPMLNREMARYKSSDETSTQISDLLRSIEVIFFTLVISIIIIGFGASKVIAQYWIKNSSLNIEQSQHAVFLMILVALLRVGEGLYRGALLGLGRHTLANFLMAGLATLRGGGSVLVIAYIAPSVEAFFVWQAAVTACGVFMSALCVHTSLGQRIRPARFSYRALFEIRRFTGAIFITTILSLFLTQVDKILLLRLLPLEEFAHYSLATTVVAGLYQLVGPLAQSYYPRFSHLVAIGDQDQLIKFYHQGAQLISVAIIPVAATLIACSTEILTLWAGKVIAAGPTSELLPILTAGTMLHCMMYMPYMLQLASGWSSFAVWINLIAVFFIVPAVLILVPVYGPIGAAGAWLSLNSGYVLFSAHFMHKRLLRREKWQWYLQDVGAPLLAVTLTSLILNFAHPQISGKITNLLWIGFFGLSVFMAAALTTPASRMIIKIIVKRLRKNQPALNLTVPEE
jgi:O-antigen/teichoic acid export membrane protein